MLELEMASGAVDEPQKKTQDTVSATGTRRQLQDTGTTNSKHMPEGRTGTHRTEAAEDGVGRWW